MQVRLAQLRCRYLSNLEAKLITEYNDILKQEESLWLQKSRVWWLKEGEGHTKFFHATTVIRRRASRITCLENNQGEWIENVDELKCMARNFYELLYSSEGYETSRQSFLNFPKLSNRDL